MTLISISLVFGYGQLIDPDSTCSILGACSNIAYLNYDNIGDLNITGNLSVYGTSFFNGSLIPMTTLSFDIGSGPNRWNVIYGSNLSIENVDISEDLTLTGTLTAGDLVWNGTLDLGGNNITNVRAIVGLPFDFMIGTSSRFHIGIGGDIDMAGTFDNDGSMFTSDLTIRRSRLLGYLISTINDAGITVYDNSAGDNVMINLTTDGNYIGVGNVTADWGFFNNLNVTEDLIIYGNSSFIDDNNFEFLTISRHFDSLVGLIAEGISIEREGNNIGVLGRVIDHPAYGNITGFLFKKENAEGNAGVVVFDESTEDLAGFTSWHGIYLGDTDADVVGGLNISIFRGTTSPIFNIEGATGNIVSSGNITANWGFFNNLNVTGTSYLGDVILDVQNITADYHCDGGGCFNFTLYNNSYWISTSNATYISYATNVSKNWSLETFNNWNTIWSRTDNSSYALNTSSAIQLLINGTSLNLTNLQVTGILRAGELVWDGNLDLGGNNLTNINKILALDWTNITLDNSQINWMENEDIGNLNFTADNLFLGNADGDHYIYFYEGASATGANIHWDDGNTWFVFTNQIRVGGDIVGANDIWTTGGGDDLWLGHSIQANANFQAYTTGNLVAKGITSLGNAAQLTVDASGNLITTGTLSAGAGGFDVDASGNIDVSTITSDSTGTFGNIVTIAKNVAGDFNALVIRNTQDNAILNTVRIQGAFRSAGNIAGNMGWRAEQDFGVPVDKDSKWFATVLNNNVEGIAIIAHKTGDILLGASALTDTPTYPLTVDKSVSNISIWAQDKIVGAEFVVESFNYIDKKGLSSSDWIKDSSEYLNPDGSVKHNASYGYTFWNIIDFSRPKNYEDISGLPDKVQEECSGNYKVIKEFFNETSGLNETIYELIDYTCYPFEITEEGIGVFEEVTMLRQNIFELRQENQMFKDALCTLGSFEFCGAEL